MDLTTLIKVFMNRNVSLTNVNLSDKKPPCSSNPAQLAGGR